MKSFFAAVAGFCLCAIVFVAMGSRPSEPASPEGEVQLDNRIMAGQGEPYYPAVKMPDFLTFAGEPVPLHVPDVRERMDRELLVNSYWHSQTLQNIKLANRWFPVIEEVLRREGLPEDFKYLAVAESNLRNVVSPARATGVWQLLSATAKENGLTVNSEVDQRYDVDKATEAACAYLKESYERYDGNWTLAAASYNMGKAGVDRRLSEQKVDNYYDLYLNTETSRYVFRILAFKLIYEQHERFGFILDQEDYYAPLDYYLVEISSTVPDLAQWAKDQGSTYKELKLMNPWLRANRLTVYSGQSYQVKLPRKEAEEASPAGE